MPKHLCPWCRTVRPLKKDGCYRKHERSKRLGNGNWTSEVCLGSGRDFHDKPKRIIVNGQQRFV